MSERTIILYGSGSPLIVDYEEICRRNNIKIAAIVDNISTTENYSNSNFPHISPCQISQINYNLFLCPLFTPYNRFKATTEALELNLKSFQILNAQSNLLSLDFEHGKGCFLNKGIIIGASSVIGDHVLINRGATLGHHLILDNYVSIGPGVVTGGNVTIQRGALIGTGSTVLPTIKIGKHAIVGAGSVVTKDVEDFAVVMGNPARKIKESEINF